MPDVITDMASVYSVTPGISGADVQQYPNMVGIPAGFRQPTPSDASEIGFAGADATIVSKVKPLWGTQPAAVSIPNFVKGDIKRTTSSVTVSPGCFGAFCGYQAAELDWTPVDVIKTDSMERTKFVGSDTTVFFGRPVPASRMDSLTAVVAGAAFDYGQRMIPDASQTFDTFAGGLNRKIEGSVVRFIDWAKGLSADSKLIRNRTSWVGNTIGWLQDITDVVQQPWNRNLMGTGWNAFAGGVGVKTGADMPATKGMLFATVG
jgi:hypothetical protein